MRRLLRIVGYVLVVLLAVGTVALAIVYITTGSRLNRVYAVERRPMAISTGTEAVERGRHLARIHLCFECHGSDLGGRMFADIPLTATLPAPNLTRGRGGAAARFAPEDWVRAVFHGLHQDGRPLVFMPSHELRQMTDEDLGSIVAFVTQLPPIDREWPPTSVKVLGRLMLLRSSQVLLPAEHIDHAAARDAPPAAAPTAAYGEYLASTVGCRGCHRSDLSGGAGPPPGAANLTPAGAIKGWTEADFVRAVRTGTRPDGSTIAPSMPRDFRELTDIELRALWMYIQSVPPRTTVARR